MLAGLELGGDHPVRMMGIINASPESFLKSSIHTSPDSLRGVVHTMEEGGADYIDVGGMSTAPYLDTMISEEAELRRVRDALDTILDAAHIPVSIDTSRAAVAAAALDMGASILNDVTGLQNPAMSGIISKYDPGLVLCAHDPYSDGSIQYTTSLLADIVRRALDMGADRNNMVVDPAIGFFGDRASGTWARRDMNIILNLRQVAGDMPILVSVSNKSFIGHILDCTEPDRRLYGSLAAETLAAFGGADIIRTHNISYSRDAALVASAFCRARQGGADDPRRVS